MTGTGVAALPPVPKFEIRQILEYVGATLPHSVRSGWQKMRCPFHDDRNPSASVNDAYQWFKCHSCGFSGDGIDVIRHVEGTDFKAAYEEATRICGESGGLVLGKSGQRHIIFGE